MHNDLDRPRGSSKIITWRGYTFKSINECAIVLGRSWDTVRKHQTKGTLDSLEPTKSVCIPSAKYVWRNQKFSRAEELAAFIGCSPATIRKRRSAGTLDELDPVTFKPPQKHTDIILHGKVYKDIHAIAEAYKRSEQTVLRHINAQTLENLGRGITAKPITIGTRTFPSRIAAARHFNVTASTIRRLLATNNLDRLLEGNIKNKQSVTIGSLTFPSLSTAARHFGVSSTTITNLIRSNDLDRLQNGSLTRKYQKGIRVTREITIEGKKFHSASSVAEHFGVALTTVYKYRNLGMLEHYILARRDYYNGSDHFGLPCRWRGYTFPSQSSLARAIGRAPNTILNHLEKTGSVDHLKPKERSPLWHTLNEQQE